jgi:hypothetical protein
MANLSQFRFRIVTTDSVGAYTTAHAACQADALASLQGQLTRWETALASPWAQRLPPLV